MNLYVNDLILEVTRRCNMCCDHCLRGDAQNLDISDEILETVARNIQPLTVVFSGGEPSLNVAAIERYFALTEKYGTMPYSFYVITNGKANQEDLAIALLRAYGKMTEPELCGLALSIDSFHETVTAGMEVFKGLTFFSDKDKAHPLNERNPGWIINSGRANINGLGTRNPSRIAESVHDLITEDFSCDGRWNVIIDQLYVSANGNIVDDCDQSYEDIDNSFICKIGDLKSELEAIRADCVV